MTTIIVNIESERVTMNGQTCNFIEAGLVPNGEKVTDKGEIKEYFSEKYENETIELIFE